MFLSISEFHSRSLIVCSWWGNIEQNGTKGGDSLRDDSALVWDPTNHGGNDWLTFRLDAPSLKMTMTFVYSLFSHVLWPIFMPFSIALLETGPWRKKTISALQLVGIAVSLYLLYFILQFPVTAEVLGKHIVYVSPHFYILAVMGFYLAATCASCLLSSHKMINLFGVSLLLSFISAYRIHIASLVSVWCFFAALLSLIVYLFFKAQPFKNPWLSWPG